MNKLIFILISLSISLAGIAQENDSLASDSDSLMVLDLMQIVDLVKLTHPIVRQANLQPQFAEAELRSAKGLLDPKLAASYDLKSLKETEYWDVFNAGLKIPTWFPVDPKIEIRHAEGQYVSEEDFIAPGGNFWQVTTGISVPLGKGLIIDERRAMIKQARFYANLARADQIKEVNKVLLTVIKDYWNWYFAYQQYLLTNQSIGIAQELFNRVLIDFEFGEAAPIDTIQAKITLQNRIVDFENSKLELIKSKLNLSIHLWDENDVPVELEDFVIPSDSISWGLVPSDSGLITLTQWALQNHPEIMKLEAKKNQLEIERRWNAESLKPGIDISYSTIDQPLTPDGGTTGIDFNDNYKLGMDFSFPILLRKERGKLQKTKLYIESTEFSISQTKQQVLAEIRADFAELKTNTILAQQYNSMAQSYERLLDAELFNLETGESDLFKINIQQDKYIEAKVKALKARAAYEKMRAILPYAIGLPELSYEKVYE